MYLFEQEAHLPRQIIETYHVNVFNKLGGKHSLPTNSEAVAAASSALKCGCT